MPGIKHDDGKVRMDLLPDDALLLVAECLTLGAAEYGDRNWEEGLTASRQEAAIKRHLARWKLHQTYDPKSKLSHLVHVATDALMMVALEARHVEGFDDRPDVYAVGLVFDRIFERGVE